MVRRKDIISSTLVIVKMNSDLYRKRLSFSDELLFEGQNYESHGTEWIIPHMSSYESFTAMMMHQVGDHPYNYGAPSIRT